MSIPKEMVELYEAFMTCTTSEIDGLSGEARATVELDDVHVLRVLVREAEAGHPEALLTLGRLHFI